MSCIDMIFLVKIILVYSTEFAYVSDTSSSIVVCTHALEQALEKKVTWSNFGNFVEV